MKLDGHRVLITGGSAGIGLALAEDFLAAGCRVAVCGRDPERLAAAEQKLPGLVTLQGDVADDDDIARLAAGAEERLEGLSILVNNAGIQFQTTFPDDPLEEIMTRVEREISVNLTGLVKLTATCLPALARADDAAVVNVSSGLALVPKKSAPIYCATKAAVHSFSKALRFQLEDQRPSIRVFEVLPPMVDTQMTAGRGDRPGQKITTARVAKETLDGMRRDRYEINVATVKLLKWVKRLAPGVAARILRNV